MNPMLAIAKRRPGHVELTVPPAVRLFYVGLGALLIFLLSQGPGTDAMVYVFGILIALGALSEDRWIFDAESKEVRHRFGLLVFLKSWAIDSGEVASIELDPESDGMAANDPFMTLPGGVRKGQSSIRLVLGDGRSLTVCAAAKKRLPALRERAKAISEALGRPLVET